MASRNILVAIRREVADYFTGDPRYRFEGLSDSNQVGGALVLSQRRRVGGGERRKLVIRYSFGRHALDRTVDADEHLRYEYRWLRRLLGCEHILQMIPMADCSVELPGTSDGRRPPYPPYAYGARSASASSLDTRPSRWKRMRQALRRRLPARWSQGAGNDGLYGVRPEAIVPLENRRYPTFATEYLPLGTLKQFLHRVLHKDYVMIPNRLLWRIWLCIVRQNIAMAFPPDIPDGQYRGQLIRETLKPQIQLRLVHYANHLDNMVFADSDSILKGIEHGEPHLGVKLLEFSRVKMANWEESLWNLPTRPDEFASRHNLFNAAFTLQSIACFTAYLAGETFSVDYNSAATYPVDMGGFQFRDVRTFAHPVFMDNEAVDPSLRQLICRTMNTRAADTPSLKTQLDICLEAVKRGEDDPGFPRIGTDETDSTIRKMLKECIYDA
ncbi:hypothetical protein F5Y17DRAFT_17368 [Xylariaceae sp. FL0594]|nr:hypothetical protein F5Y17DRAFT_17368 [Xylariaceae sp. FL0594]